MCDFCGAEDAVWLYRSDPMDLVVAGPTIAYHDQMGTAWQACAECAASIEADDLQGLANRTMRRAPAALRTDTAVAAQAFVQLQTAFLRARQPGRTPLIPLGQQWRMRPELLPKVRDRLAAVWTHHLTGRMADVLADGRDLTLPARLVESDPPGPAGGITGTVDLDVLTRFAASTADALYGAALYWIDDTFTDLAVHAADRLPDLAIEPDQIPAGSGLAVWAHPIARSDRDGPPLPVVAAHWQRLDGGVWVSFYTPVGLGRSGAQLQHMREELGWLIPFSPGWPSRSPVPARATRWSSGPWEGWSPPG